MTERLEPLDGEPWDIDTIRGALNLVENALNDLETAGMLSDDAKAAFAVLIKLLEEETQGFLDANRY